MSTSFPTSLDSYTDKTASDDVLAEHINNPQDAIEAMQAKIGIDNSSDSSSHDYKINQIENKITYSTIYIDAGVIVPASSLNASVNTLRLSVENDANIDVISFSEASTIYCDFKLVMPEVWDRSTIKAKFYWTPEATTVTVGSTVKWSIKAVSLSDSDNIENNYGNNYSATDTIIDHSGYYPKLHKTKATNSIVIGGVSNNEDLLLFKLGRNATSADDTVKSKINLHSVLIKYGISNNATAW